MLYVEKVTAYGREVWKVLEESGRVVCRCDSSEDARRIVAALSVVVS